MTGRKPAGASWESWVDRQVREAQERGEFDGLPGAGKPIAGIDQPRDELWWVRQLVQREELPVTPPTLALRRDIERAREHIAGARSEAAVRAVVEEINARIVEVNTKATAGPPSTLMPLDVDAILRTWHRTRGDGPGEDAVARPSVDAIRRARFPIAFGGYRRREVQRRLGEIAGALEAGRSPAPVRRPLRRTLRGYDTAAVDRFLEATI